MEEKDFKAWLERQRRSLDLELTDDGAWLHNQEPFVHQGIIKAFNEGIGLHPESGEPIVSIGSTWCYFRSRRSPFIAVRLLTIEQKIDAVLLNTGEKLSLRDTYPTYFDEQLNLHTADGRTVRLSRTTQAAVAPFLTTDDQGFVLVTTDGLRLIDS